MNSAVLLQTVLVRYGAIPEVARFRTAASERLERGSAAVVRTHRGLELGAVLQDVEEDVPRVSLSEEPGSEPQILRLATADDLRQHARLRAAAEADYESWCERIRQWNLHLQLLDLEWMLDGQKLVLYVLNERGPDCTKLALQAAAAGLGIVEVQPVDAHGLVQLETSGGCGSGGCGSGGCDSH